MNSINITAKGLEKILNQYRFLVKQIYKEKQKTFIGEFMWKYLKAFDVAERKGWYVILFKNKYKVIEPDDMPVNIIKYLKSLK